MSHEVIAVDENDNFIRNAPRQQVHASKEWHRGTHSFLFDRNGRLLLILRSKEKDKFPLHWECAISEHVDPGEDYEEAIRRGLKEELEIDDVQLKKFMKFRMPYGSEDYMISELFTGEIQRLPKINEREIEKIEFVSIETIETEIDDKK